MHGSRANPRRRIDADRVRRARTPASCSAPERVTAWPKQRDLESETGCDTTRKGREQMLRCVCWGMCTAAHRRATRPVEGVVNVGDWQDML